MASRADSWSRPTERNEGYGTGSDTHTCGTGGTLAAVSSSIRGERRAEVGLWGAPDKRSSKRGLGSWRESLHGRHDCKE